jgi:hypothetical protein
MWVLMKARRFGFGRHPLRRRVDRIESAIILAAVLVALLMIPVAVALGTSVRDSSEQAAAQRRATLTEVQARTLEDAATAVVGGSGVVTAWVRVAWTDSVGLPREGYAGAMHGTKKGSEVTIWLDRSGAITTPPRRAGDSEAVGGAVGLSAGMLSWLLIAGLARLAVARLDRRRMRDWEREWEQVAPRWRHHQN